MTKIKRWSRKYTVLVSILLLLGGSALAIKIIYGDYIKGYLEDHDDSAWPVDRGGSMSNIERAEYIIRRSINGIPIYISSCKRFPENFEDAHIDRGSTLIGCKPFDTEFGLSAYFRKSNLTPWIDPWGRPFQIRYHKERRKVQMRSQGRYVDDPSDDIVRETNLAIKKDVYEVEMKKCNEPSDNDCVFSRGWH